MKYFNWSKLIPQYTKSRVVMYGKYGLWPEKEVIGSKVRIQNQSSFQMPCISCYVFGTMQIILWIENHFICPTIQFKYITVLKNIKTLVHESELIGSGPGPSPRSWRPTLGVGGINPLLAGSLALLREVTCERSQGIQLMGKFFGRAWSRRASFPGPAQHLRLAKPYGCTENSWCSRTGDYLFLVSTRGNLGGRGQVICLVMWVNWELKTKTRPFWF